MLQLYSAGESGLSNHENHSIAFEDILSPVACKQSIPVTVVPLFDRVIQGLTSSV